MIGRTLFKPTVLSIRQQSLGEGLSSPTERNRLHFPQIARQTTLPKEFLKHPQTIPQMLDHWYTAVPSMFQTRQLLKKGYL